VSLFAFLRPQFLGTVIVVGETQVLHCACGSTREAPVGLSILSCVQCGAAMYPKTEATEPPPARTLVSTATLASQLLGTIAFALALFWLVVLRVHDATVIGVLVTGAVVVFAGGHAHRGSVVALALCAAFDVAVAIAMFAKPPVALAFVWAPLARASETLAARHELVMITLGAIAALAAIACGAARAQARRFAAWRDTRILHAARVSRGSL
jgi:hypothetical protein